MATTVEYSERFARGEFISSGVSGIIERLPDGLVLKSPWPGSQEEECKEDIKLEAHAYHRLAQNFGSHKRFIAVLAYDAVLSTITMEYMANGSLREYLSDSDRVVSQGQRYKWILAMIEGMELIHSVRIVHCDFSPKNFLLDEELELKVADFACCSIDGQPSLAGGSSRFYPPRQSWRSPVTFEHDLFALGSCIYELLTGETPFKDVSSPCVRNLYRLKQFPDLTMIEARDVILDCWLFQAESASAVHRRMLAALLL